MENNRGILNLRDKDGDENIPIIPMRHINLEKYADRTSYSKSMLDDFKNITSYDSVGGGVHEVFMYDLMDLYNIQAMNDFYDNHVLNKTFSSTEGIKWLTLYKTGKMMASAMVVKRLLHGKKHPYRLYNNTSRKVVLDDNGDFRVSTGGSEREGDIHSSLFSSRLGGFYGITSKWYMPYHDIERSHTTHRDIDYSNIYHSNDSLFFVGSRGQALQLLFMMADNQMDRICVPKIDIYFYDILKHLDGGIIPDHMKENVNQYNVNANGVDVPIVDEISNDKFVFYKHNFDRYKDEIYKEMKSL